MHPEAYRALRKRTGLSQTGAAAELGVNRCTISHRETGRDPISREAELAMRYVALMAAKEETRR